ncbi:SDR family NAD(P)-dependent oxidoreductase [Paenibacillus sp. MBLB4367]|uniref:SDR family NAD(P)-dependent oxidoreductase n=1 Tax=Paenibacillus sp. MBLB4367 TaxID=3384767 RepID=UPI00390821D1
MSRLRDKICVVVGGASGIGAGVAKRFAKEGAFVVIADIQAEGGERVTEEIRSAGGQGEWHAVNAADERQMIALFEHVGRQYRKVDVLQTNTFWAEAKNAEETTLAEWNKCMDVTLTAPFLCSKYAIPLMKNGGGSIIHTASVGGVVAFRNHVAYTVAKAGLIHLCKSIAVDFAEYHIRCNAICPGIIDTPATRANDTEELRKVRMSKTLSGRYGTPDDIAAAAVYLAGDESSFVTGTAMMIDSGWSII